jgi:hypothetical protein
VRYIKKAQKALLDWDCMYRIKVRKAITNYTITALYQSEMKLSKIEGE